jgi:D-cysteine desulfhydrase family pyridoxal phosphate-dependent enzyme
MAQYSLTDINKKINKHPQKKFVLSPTPFYKLENLSRILGGPEIYIKRDDLTGFAFGGNKSRKLEFIIEDVLQKQCDAIITWASLQSNWCLQTAAAARKYGITPVLILFKTYDLPEEYDGNLLLDLILDADIRIKEAELGKVVSESFVEGILSELEDELKGKGLNPYTAPIGGSFVGGSMDIPLGAIGYVKAFSEMMNQTAIDNLEVDCVIHASGSGGTQAGLVVGAKALTEKTKVLGISVSDEKEPFSKDVLDISRDTVKALDLDLEITEQDVLVMDEYIQDGYGIVNKDVSDAVRIMAMNESIFIDPVYTGKAITALIDLVKKGYFRKEDKIVFFHTGGTAALFPNKHLLQKFLGA